MIGAGVRVSGYELAGAVVCPADGRAETRAAWAALPPDIDVVVLTPEAAGWLADVLGPVPVTAIQPDGLAPRRGLLPVVLPP